MVAKVVRLGRLVRATSVVASLACAVVLACGETRQPIGEECLRDDDCLSNVCSARTCVPAPQLTVPYGGKPDEEPSIPDSDGGGTTVRDASRDGPG